MRMIHDYELNYRANLLFGTLEIPDGMQAIGLLNDAEYDKQVEFVIRSTWDNPDALRSAYRDLAKIMRFKELNSQKDGLTGIFNRRFYDQMLADQIKLVEQMANPGQRTHVRATRGVAILMIDMDRFKAINDTHGHLAGDEALRLVAKIMIENVREQDIVARTGGDEFSILLKNITKEEAESILQKLQVNIDEAILEYSNGEEDFEIDVNASVGMTMVEIGQDADKIADNADKDMFARKQARKEANPALRYDRT
jgi:diguanylate cyclase (GGDEF)-like protein